MPHIRSKYPALYACLGAIGRAAYRKRVPLRASIRKSGEPILFAELNESDFRPARNPEPWGREYACAWLRLEGTVPDDLEKPQLLIHNKGESLLYTENGAPFDGVTFLWTNGDMPQCSGKYRAAALPYRPGESFTLYADCGFNGFMPMQFDQGVFRGAWLAEVDKEAHAYYYDFLALLLLAGSTQDTALRRALGHALKASFAAFNRHGASKARESLAPHLAAPSDDPLEYTAVGHGHLDLAWLWPIRETVRKAARTYSIALGNLERYPWYVYGTSQPQQLLWMREHYPSIYERVRGAIRAGRIEPQGGFFAECDTNLPSGESMIRQTLYGKRAWREICDMDARMCWLPDTFGYSGNLPQILKKCGMDYFSTIKLSWNKVNVFPYRTFRWQGIDGSSVLVHMPPEGDYNSAAGAQNLLAGKKRYPEQELNAALLVYGSGDGGGGPAERHLELVAREQSLKGLPRVRPGRAIDFFDALAKKDIPHGYAGELYLETHQGTYTTQGKNKYYNRLCERLLHEAEAASVLAGADYAFPRAEVDDLWREALLYQFHDIIPGSSIGRVYTESVARYEKMAARLEEIVSGALAPANAADSPLCAVNLTSFPREEYVEHEGEWYRACVPPYAARRLERAPGEAPELRAVRDTLSNGLLTLTFGSGGEIISCKDEHGRELSGGFLNRLTLYQDRFVYPFNAWDIEQKYYKRPARNLRAQSSETFIEGTRAVKRSVYRFGRSKAEQDVILEAGSSTVRVELRVDWRETLRMLRADFAPRDYGDTARFEIQFGAIERATTERDSLEKAQFEVCAHKYVAVQGEAGGFALMNESKYGHRVKNGRISLNLLRAPVFPDPKADRGAHKIVYAFCPFEKDDFLRPVREGYRLNNPLRIALRPEAESLVSCDAPNVVVETVKRAEDGEGVALRLYEALGKEAQARVTTAIPYESAYCADMLENPGTDADLSCLRFTPYEVKTILLRGGALLWK
ncbi:MAG TPA: glycoside hydrolase family 38 C-terminal domain-containing protein [Clostridia bacterium]|nr:glycoside hydrolase family 38 C-terminal domain-containing protein [Clostridia bacterium]